MKHNRPLALDLERIFQMYWAIGKTNAVPKWDRMYETNWNMSNPALVVMQESVQEPRGLEDHRVCLRLSPSSLLLLGCTTFDRVQFAFFPVTFFLPSCRITFGCAHYLPIPHLSSLPPSPFPTSAACSDKGLEHSGHVFISSAPEACRSPQRTGDIDALASIINNAPRSFTRVLALYHAATQAQCVAKKMLRCLLGYAMQQWDYSAYRRDGLRADLLFPASARLLGQHR